jgi:hypothetical protein
MWFLKLLLITLLFTVLYQDLKDRLVFGFLYPVIGILVFLIQLSFVSFYPALLNLSLNLVFVFFLLSVSYIYSKIRMPHYDVKAIMGIGDVLFFVFISFSFATISFVILFVFSLIFSLLLHFFLKQKQIDKTVPLAGYMQFM